MILKILFGVDSAKDIGKQIKNVFQQMNLANIAKNNIKSIKLNPWDMWNDKSLKDRTISKYAAQLKGLTVAQADAALSAAGLNAEQKKQILTNAGLITSNEGLIVSKKMITVEQQKQLVSSGLVAKSDLDQAVSIGVLTLAEKGNLVATKELTVAEMEKQLVDNGMSVIAAKNIALLYADTGAKTANAGATGLLTKAVLKLNAAWLANPWGVILGGVAAIGAVIGSIAIYNNSVDGMIKKNQKLIDSNKEIYDSILEEERTYKNNAESLKESYEQYLIATKGSEEYYNAVNKIAELSPELVVGYDNEGNALLANNDVIKAQIEYYKQLAEEKREAAKQEAEENLTEESGKYQKLKNKKDKKQKELDEGNITLSEYESIIKNAEQKLSDGEELSYNDQAEYDNALMYIENQRKAVKDLKKDIRDLSGQMLSSSNSLRTYYTALLDPVEDLTEAEKALRNGLVNTAIEESMSYDDFKLAESTLSSANVKKAAEEIINLDNNLTKTEYREQALAVYDKIKNEFETESERNSFKVSFGIDEDTIQNEMQSRSNAVGLTQELFGKDFNYISEQTKEAQQSLQDEYDKIKKWGLEEYSEDIKNGTIQSVFGNVDMDKRTIIEWSDELKKTYQEELTSWDYDPEVGIIDTVFGGSDRFGKDINGTGWEVAFTPILPDGTFLSKDAVYDYINNILTEAYADDGQVTEAELMEIDAQGRQVGNTFVQGIFAGIDEGQEYESNGNWAEVVGRLMHFAGDYGAPEIAKQALDASKALDDSYNWDNWFEEQGIDSDEEYDKWLEIARGVKTADEAMQKWIELNEKAADVSAKTFTEQMQGIHSLSEGLDQLDAIMADIIDGESFDYSSILDKDGEFAKTFNVSGLTEEYEALIKAVTNSPNDLSKCQQEFNNLATAYIHSKDALSELTEETRDAAILDLKQMGVKNADEVVDSYLELKRAKDEIVNAGYDLVNITNEEAMQFMNLSTASETAKKYLFAYQVQKAQINNNPIDTIAECNQLLNLANAAGYTGSALLYLAKIKALLNKIDNDKLDESSLGYKSVMGQITQYNGLLQQVINSEVTATKATVNFGDGLKSLAAKEEKAADAADKLTDALEKQKEALEEQKSEMEELHDAVIWFYDKQIDAIDDKIEAINEENEALEKQLETMDDVLAAIEDNYDAEIEKIQEKIDALQDENDEEERALKLEEARRKLAEAKSRKTILQYEEGKGFVYSVDTNAIKEATEELEGLQDEEVIHQLEEEINKLEEAKKKWQEIPEAYQKAMQELAAKNYFGSNWRTTTLFPSDELLQNFESDYTGTQVKIDKNEERIESLEKEKTYLEELKEAWEDALNEYKYQQYEAKLATFFGSDYEYQLLNNSAVWRRQFVNEYSAICAEIEALEERIKAANDSTTSSATTNAEKTKTAYSDTATAVEESVTRIQQSQDEIGIELEDIAGTTKEIVDEAYLKALEINTIISILDLSIGSLKARIDTLYGTLQQMDEITLSNVIAAFGGAGGYEEGTGEGSGGKSSSKGSGEKGSGGGSGLLAAVEAVSEAIGVSGEGGEGTGLLGLLDQVDAKTLENIIGQFGSEGEEGSVNASSLLNAVNTVSDAIAGEGKEDSLVSSIDKLAKDSVEPIQNVTTEFGTLLDKITECITKVEELASQIANLDTSKLGGFSASGTAHTFGAGTAHGNAYASGTRQWGLMQDKPNSLVGELGSEILVRQGKYHMIDTPTFMDLKKGDIIFNHKQTKAILQNGRKSVIDKLNEKGRAVYSKLTGSSFAAGTMSKNVFDALINGLSNTVGSFVSVPNYGARSAQYAPGYAGGQSTSINIGDIHVHGVENVNGLSQEIINRLPNTLLQKLNAL